MRDFHHVVSAYEDHEHVYNQLRTRPGTVLIRGGGIAASHRAVLLGGLRQCRGAASRRACAAAHRGAAPRTGRPDAPLPAHPPEDDNAIVVGVYCKNGHFDDPSARCCAVCGISMAQQTLVPRPGPRPPLGVLVLDDGSIFSLDTDYVVGRDPSRDPDVEGDRRPGAVGRGVTGRPSRGARRAGSHPCHHVRPHQRERGRR